MSQQLDLMIAKLGLAEELLPLLVSLDSAPFQKAPVLDLKLMCSSLRLLRL